jgi:hypothetical protein
MSQFPTNAGTRPTRGPMDIYTVLSLIALLALIVGVSFVWVRSTALFENPNPFTVVETR